MSRRYLILALLLLSACSLFDQQSDGTSATQTATTTTPTVQPTFGLPLLSTPSTLATTAPTPKPELVELVFWTTEMYTPDDNSPAGLAFAEQIQMFERANPNVTVTVLLKKEGGTGGLFDFLSTASAAAPTVLPDVIALSIPDLYHATQAGLIYPLDDLISPDLLTDRFDFAVQLTEINEETMGILYRSDVQHLVYATERIAQTPNTWFNINRSETSFVFSPAALPDGVNDMILTQYLGAGGTLFDEQGNVALDILALSRALRAIEQAHDDGVVSTSVLILNQNSTAWSEFRSGSAGIVQVPASIYLADRSQFPAADFSVIPVYAPELNPPTVGRGWALALTTADPQRQQLAVALIEHLMAPEHIGPWTEAANYLPTRRSALEFWNPSDPYVPFIRDLLERAAPAPPPGVTAIIGPPLTMALREVLTRSAKARQAAETAVNAVQEAQ